MRTKKELDKLIELVRNEPQQCKLPLTKEEGVIEAWRRVCRAYNDIPCNDVLNLPTLSTLFEVIEECKILYGDPTKEFPKGMIRTD